MQGALPIDFERLKVAKRGQIPRTRCVCLGCGKVFWRNVGKRNKGLYHSRQCAFDHHAAGGNRRKPKPKPPKPMPIRICVQCGKEFALAHHARTCSPECRRLYGNSKLRADRESRRPPKSERRCRECGRVFLSARREQSYCSRCGRRVAHRIGKAIRRARKRQVKYELVDAVTVFRRDKYRCQLCGCSTPARLRGRMVDRAPELDHIVPLSQGGSHTYDNVQCACRKCNGSKWAAVRGQLRLAI